MEITVIQTKKRLFNAVGCTTTRDMISYFANTPENKAAARNVAKHPASSILYKCIYAHAISPKDTEKSSSWGSTGRTQRW